jgi:3-deoxy-D-manno-octulosonate 8-phosphate phosphatase (KDO 8-P phosphatase)
MNTLEKFSDIRTFIFDVDGVMTDGLVHVLDDGSLLRNMHVRDAYAIRRAVETGYRLIVITAGKSMGVRLRLEELGIREIYSDVRDKLAVLTDLAVHHGLDLGETLYMGDDLPDYQAMCKVHFPVCPADSVREIIGISQYVSPYRGGEGCVREVIEKVLTLHGLWFAPKGAMADR